MHMALADLVMSLRLIFYSEYAIIGVNYIRRLLPPTDKPRCGRRL